MTYRLAALALPLFLVLGPATTATASKDVMRTYRLAAVLGDSEYQAMLPEGVTYYFGDQPVTVKTAFGPTRTNRRTSLKTQGKPMNSCRWALASALIAIGEDAKAKGGNAVVAIKSNYKNDLVSSEDTFQCAVGSLMVGVSLVGEIAIVE